MVADKCRSRAEHDKASVRIVASVPIVRGLMTEPIVRKEVASLAPSPKLHRSALRREQCESASGTPRCETRYCSSLQRVRPQRVDESRPVWTENDSRHDTPAPTVIHTLLSGMLRSGIESAVVSGVIPLIPCRHRGVFPFAGFFSLPSPRHGGTCPLPCGQVLAFFVADQAGRNRCCNAATL